MILVLGGTREGREIAAMLAKRGYRVSLAVVTGYGGELAAASGANELLVGAMDEAGMLEFLRHNEPAAVVDATHPYAVQASRNAMEACKRAGVIYIRYERPPVELPESPLILHAKNFHEAAKLAVGFGRVIFLAIGSRNLEVFLREAALAGRRVVARVLPDPEVISRCFSLGLRPEDIVAMQGPFSVALNMALLREYDASVMVTKDSGSTGGTDTKVAAALELGIPMIVVERPLLDYGNTIASFEELERLLPEPS